ncbi:hypothetical protein BGW36DRAFT_373611 [Talaromyces proteolyticus]|uniref:Uncharacterized protein n=1 Tax=Talaromyces proteolyticus TaxID=1131652 RepID=A0AAD4Q2B1_9EURO|nr:uncharacterized protein BGW36DRAFT_373611 [Talaromyces proteolyticus]KAH8700191.1 hypothetical protein BGW36DRAFT_373611 [Talaromyces proteolyticus]
MQKRKALLRASCIRLYPHNTESLTILYINVITCTLCVSIFMVMTRTYQLMLRSKYVTFLRILCRRERNQSVESYPLSVDICCCKDFECKISLFLARLHVSEKFGLDDRYSARYALPRTLLETISTSRYYLGKPETVQRKRKTLQKEQVTNIPACYWQ